MPTALEMAKITGGREGLRATSEVLAGEVAALVRELDGCEQRIRSARIDKDDDVVEKWESRAEQVRVQLRARGAEASGPHQRAAKRPGRPPAQEARA
jgi:hypothetical protein